MRIITADHVVPIAGEPIVKGAVAFEGGRIASVGPAKAVVSKYDGAQVDDLGAAAVLPGLVNCHSHLELTALRGALDNVEHDFRQWLLKINALRGAMSDEDIVRSSVLGAREGAAAGVTCFADIGRFAFAGITALREAGLRGIVYQETDFSPDERTAEDDFRKLGEKYEKLAESGTDLIRIGISPHAPYTVSSRLFELIAQYAILNRVPITIHASESREEVDLLLNDNGFFKDLYASFGFEWHSPRSTPIEYLDRLGVLSARPLLAHCVVVSDEDSRRMASNGVAVAHCPKSNAKFGHGYAPVEVFLRAGLNVGLGSDSVASNNVCDLLEESRFAALAARNHPGRESFMTAKQALELATIGGAKALGLDGEVGTLEGGKQADIAIVSLESPAQTPVKDIYAALVFSSSGRDVIETIVAGRTVYRKR